MPYPDKEKLVCKRMLSNILASTQHKQVKFYYQWYNVAAALLITMSVSLFSYHYLLSPHDKPVTKQYSYAKLPGKPGINGATLTLANEQIVLSASLNGVWQGAISIKKTATGHLIYDMSAKNSDALKSIGFNTLATARATV